MIATRRAGLQAQGEPLIVPLATPSIAGPSALAAMMLLASNDPRNMALTPAIGRLMGRVPGIRAFVEGVR